MQRKTWFSLLVVLGCLLATGSGARLAGQALAQEPVVEGVLAPQADTGTGFTYQGRLTDGSGSPIAGPCDFQFKLYNDLLSPVQVGSTVTRSNVTLTDGFFSAGVDFGSGAFDGEGRQLQVLVRCPAGSGSYETLSPMVSLEAAPYAHSLRPGAQISSSTAGELSAVLSVEDTYSGGFASTALLGKSTKGIGVQGESGSGYGVQGLATSGTGVYGSGSINGVYGGSSSTIGTGVYGKASATSGSTAGVVGENDSPSGAGVAGYADATSGTNYGVYGTTDSPDGYGVYATNTAAGAALDEPTAIYAEVNAAEGFALYGLNNSGRGIVGEGYGRYGVGGFSDTSYGVFGKSSSGSGVKGEATYTGTVGIALASSGTAYGVYGEAEDSADGVGVYGRGSKYGIYGSNNGGTGVYGYAGQGSGTGVRGYAGGGTGVYGEGIRGVYGTTSWSGGAGGRFLNTDTTFDASNVGVWAGSYGGDIIQGWDLTSGGDPAGRRFRVTWEGDVYADGTYYGAGGVSSGSADFAEMMLPGQADLEPGDVLAVDPSGQMVRSTEPYQATVVGVYSTEPGFIAGNKFDEDGAPLESERIPLAVVGVVPVKASAENGAIQPGDLLVASATPGHAMKGGSNPPIGTVIGKALEGLEGGTGVISMLVILQ